MFGEITLASPDATSRTPKAPMNCQRDHGASPPKRGQREDDADQVEKRKEENEEQASKGPSDPSFAFLSPTGEHEVARKPD
jgi:hypothetical protein